MSDLTPLVPTVELPASEFMEHDGGLLVRCPLNGVWVPLSDYYSETFDGLLPLVGKVDYEANKTAWEDSGVRTPQGEVVMHQIEVEGPVVWKETVRILKKVEEAAPEGGVLEMNVHDEVGLKDKF